MSQYDIVKYVFNSNKEVSKKDIISHMDLHSSSVEAGIKQCIKKGYIKQTEKGYDTVDSFDQQKLESIRPKTLDELTDKN